MPVHVKLCASGGGGKSILESRKALELWRVSSSKSYSANYFN